MTPNSALFKRQPLDQLISSRPDDCSKSIRRLISGALLLCAGFVIPQAGAAEVPFILPPPVDSIIGPDSVVAGNIDNDGIPDVVAAARDNGFDDDNNHLVAWYKFDKATGLWTQTIIDQGTSVLRPVGLAIGNINAGDSNADVVVGLTDTNEVVWYQNPGDGSPNWTRTVIDDGLSGATLSPDGVAIADVDGVNGPDVIVAFRGSDNVYWYANPGDGSANWPKTVVATSGEVKGPRWILTTDIDGDAQFDIVVASAELNDSTDSAGSVAWYEESETVAGDWEQRFIDADDPAVFITLANIDGDANLDIVAALRPLDQIVWYQNPGDGSQNWQANLIAEDLTFLNSVRKLAKADIDGDGDDDLYSVAYEGDTVAWHENPRIGANANWVLHVISTGSPANGSASIASGDFDNDGDEDAFAAFFDGESLNWYRNGQQHGVIVTSQANPPNFTVTEAAGAGHTATFNVTLTSAPTANVAIPVSSADLTEGTVNPNPATPNAPITLNFPANTTGPQTFTVTGVDELIGDGNVNFDIQLGAITSTDVDYSGLDPSDITITNIDNDTAGVTVTPTSGLITSETGTTATFSVVLNAQPTANVTVALSSLDNTEGSVSPTSLVFTAGPTGNWNVPRTVTITGLNDNVDDGNILYTVQVGPVTSTDAIYTAINPPDVTVTNQDDADTAGFTVDPTSGLGTSEAGFNTTFTVRLNTQPTANVSFNLSSSDPGEGIPTPTSLTFTTVNWNNPQIVTVTGINDTAADGNISYNIVLGTAVSADPKYNGLNPPDVSITNFDDDGGGNGTVLVSPISRATTEGGGTATFTVGLSTNPQGNATMAITSSDTTEGTVNKSSLTFTTANWMTPQIVTVTGVNDNIVDGNITYTILLGPISGTSTIYNGINPPDVTVVNQDNDAAGGNAIFSDDFEN